MHINNLIEGLNSYGLNKKVQGTEQSGGGAGSKKTGSSQSSDKVNLSSEAKLRASAYNEASGASGVREDKVAALREQVQNGTYVIDDRKTAENLVRDDLDLIT
jgi:negative regulator of flagellin synthesis FlgM